MNTKGMSCTFGWYFKSLLPNMPYDYEIAGPYAAICLTCPTCELLEDRMHCEILCPSQNLMNLVCYPFPIKCLLNCIASSYWRFTFLIIWLVNAFFLITFLSDTFPVWLILSHASDIFSFQSCVTDHFHHSWDWCLLIYFKSQAASFSLFLCVRNQSFIFNISVNQA